MPRGTVGESEEHIEVRRRARPWRRLTFLGGALMVATFFLPAVRSCSSDVVPASDLCGIVGEVVSRPGDGSFPNYALWIPMLSVAYLLGLVLALAAVARAAGWLGWSRWLGWLLVFVLIATVLDVMAVFTCMVVREGSFPSDWYWWVSCVAGPLITLIYLPVAWRPAERRRYCTAFLVAWWMCCWFGFWVVFADARYGVYLSLAAGGILLVAVVGEARALTRQTWLRTFGQLLIGRLVPPAAVRGSCRRCGYLLFGLSERRCPECGRGFTPEEVGLSAEELAAAANLGSPAGPTL